jgi:hypothetical protein
VFKKYLGFCLAVIIVFLSLTMDSFASVDIELGAPGDAITVEGSQEIYRTEYSTEYYETTCYRTVSDGYDRDCTTVYENRCEKVPGVGDICHREPSTSCRTVERTRQEAYSCTESRTVSNSVYDHTVFAKFDVVKTLRARNFDLNDCKIHITNINDKNESYSATCGTAIVRANVISRVDTKAGLDKNRVVKLEVDFADISGLSALKSGLSAVNFSNGILSFKTADLSVATNFALSLSITRNRFLLKDKVVFSGTIKSSNYTLEKLEDARVKVSVNLSKMGAGFDASKKHTLKLTLKTIKAVDVKNALNTPSLSNQATGSIVVNN